MAKAKKLKSGSWNIMVYSHTDSAGKRHYESFTAASKTEVELKAAEFKASKKRRVRHDLTVAEALNGYITSKDGVLSPSTIRGYRRMERCNYEPISKKFVNRLTSEDLQLFVSELSRDHSPKTVANVYALLSASLSMYAPDLNFKVTLPAKKKQLRVSPSDDDVSRLFSAADDKLKICIALAAFGSLRRGEACALKYNDIQGDSVYVHADLVQDASGEWIYKDMPKNAESVRIVNLPHEVIELLGNGDPDEFIVKYALPNTVSNRFKTLRNKLGINIRYHDLRHYFASIGAVLNIPDTYLSGFGGWRQDSPIMKNVYQNKIVPISEVYAQKMTSHFSSVIGMQDEMQDGFSESRID